MEPRVSRRPCFVEEDTGLASLAVADMEAGFSGNNNNQINSSFCSRPVRRGSLRNLSALASSSVASVSSSSPRSGYRFYDARYEEPQAHFLDACFNCKKALGNNRDIFMYRSVSVIGLDLKSLLIFLVFEVGCRIGDLSYSQISKSETLTEIDCFLRSMLLFSLSANIFLAAKRAMPFTF